MVYSREEAARRAEASHTNVPGTCQLWTRTMLGAPSAGDQDSDGDSDAVDGWNSEPSKARHPEDRNPPRGVPVAWSGGRSGFGHRAISLGGGRIRSTDAGGSGVVATVDLGWVEQAWGLHYLGWSETITGLPIPGAPIQEDDMANYADQLTRIEQAQTRMDRTLDRLVKAERRRNLADIERVRRIVKKIVGVEATTERIEKAIAELDADET